MATVVEISRKQQKISISLIFKCELSQAITPLDISMVIKKNPCSLSIHAILFDLLRKGTSHRIQLDTKSMPM